MRKRRSKGLWGHSKGLLGLVLLLAAPAWGTGRDVLSSLEGNPSAAATDEVSDLYRRSRNPFARLWLVDVLYGRVRKHGDPKALEALVAASRDKNPDVRRRAVSGLESFRFLSAQDVRQAWIARLGQAASQAEKDPVPGVRGAGQQLRRSIERWERGAAEGRKAERPARDEGLYAEEAPSREPREWRRAWGVLLWIVAFQLLACLWQRLAVSVLGASEEAWAPVRAAWRACMDRPLLFVYPIGAVAMVTLVIGVSGARFLISLALPPEAAPWGPRAVLLAAAVYFSAGLCAFIPAAVLAGTLALGTSARPLPGRIPGFMALGLYLLLLWPRELAARLSGRPLPASWAARVGAPLAGAFAAALMARRGLGWRQALKEAASSFAGAAGEPAAKLLGRPLAQPAAALLILAAPTLAALAVPPAVWASGFSPARMFGFWFVTEGAFAVGFGLWAGAIMSACGLTVLACLAAVHAGREVGHG